MVATKTDPSMLWQQLILLRPPTGEELVAIIQAGQVPEDLVWNYIDQHGTGQILAVLVCRLNTPERQQRALSIMERSPRGPQRAIDPEDWVTVIENGEPAAAQRAWRWLWILYNDQRREINQQVAVALVKRARRPPDRNGPLPDAVVLEIGQLCLDGPYLDIDQAIALARAWPILLNAPGRLLGRGDIEAKHLNRWHTGMPVTIVTELARHIIAEGGPSYTWDLIWWGICHSPDDALAKQQFDRLCQVELQPRDVSRLHETVRLEHNVRRLVIPRFIIEWMLEQTDDEVAVEDLFYCWEQADRNSPGLSEKIITRLLRHRDCPTRRMRETAEVCASWRELVVNGLFDHPRATVADLQWVAWEQPDLAKAVAARIETIRGTDPDHIIAQLTGVAG